MKMSLASTHGHLPSTVAVMWRDLSIFPLMSFVNASVNLTVASLCMLFAKADFAVILPPEFLQETVLTATTLPAVSVSMMLCIMTEN